MIEDAKSSTRFLSTIQSRTNSRPLRQTDQRWAPRVPRRDLRIGEGILPTRDPERIADIQLPHRDRNACARQYVHVYIQRPYRRVVTTTTALWWSDADLAVPGQSGRDATWRTVRADRPKARATRQADRGSRLESAPTSNSSSKFDALLANGRQTRCASQIANSGAPLEALRSRFSDGAVRSGVHHRGRTADARPPGVLTTTLSVGSASFRRAFFVEFEFADRDCPTLSSCGTRSSSAFGFPASLASSLRRVAISIPAGVSDTFLGFPKISANGGTCRVRVYTSDSAAATF